MVLEDRTLVAAGLLIVSCAFGGGGSEAGLANLVVQLAAIFVLALYPQDLFNFFRGAPRLAVGLVGLVLLLPLLQIIPLPPSLWQTLPGRGLVRDTLRFMGRGDVWFPMSLEWRRTFLAFLSLLPPLAIITLVWSQSEASKRRLLFLVVVLGGILVLVGGPQLAAGNRQFMFFNENIGSQELHGWFANRNSAGLFLTLSLTALVGAFPERRRGLKWSLAAGGMAGLLLLGVVLTRSRSSMALCVVPFAFAICRFARHYLQGGRGRKVVLGVVAGVLVLAVGGGALLSQNSQIHGSLIRFESLDDHRSHIWSDTLAAIGRFWPVGSGIGTFDEVFQLNESLETLTPGRAGRAHNDFLEVTLESGIVGLTAVAIGFVFVFKCALQACRVGGSCRIAACMASVVLLQSVSDYPLRNQALLCIGGLIMALLIHAPFERHAALQEEV